MRQIVLAGLGDHVARKISTQGLSVEDQKRLNHGYQVKEGLMSNVHVWTVGLTVVFLLFVVLCCVVLCFFFFVFFFLLLLVHFV